MSKVKVVFYCFVCGSKIPNHLVKAYFGFIGFCDKCGKTQKLKRRFERKK